MALCTSEGTAPEVMELFKVKGGFSAGYVKIRKWEIQPEYNTVLLLIGKYASEEARQADQDNCENYEFGFPITAEAMETMQNADDRDIFYPYLEAQIQFIELGEAKNLEEWTDEVYNEKVQALYDYYEIENPYAVKAEEKEQ